VKPGENCPDCGRPTETVTEANFYFKLSAFQKPLLDWYSKHPDFIQPEARRNEVLSFVEGGSEISASRAPRFAGAFLFPAKSRTFFMCGSTRSPRISAPWAARSMRKLDSGLPISILSAKKSSASTPCTGPRF